MFHLVSKITDFPDVLQFFSKIPTALNIGVAYARAVHSPQESITPSLISLTAHGVEVASANSGALCGFQLLVLCNTWQAMVLVCES